MLGRKVEKVRPVLLAEVRQILEQRLGEPDFGYEQQTSLDYARKFSKLTLEDANKLYQELSEEFPSLKPETIIKLVDILPKHASTILAILAKERASFSAAQMQKCLEMISKYRERMIAPATIQNVEKESEADIAKEAQEEKEQKLQEEQKPKKQKTSKAGSAEPAKGKKAEA